MIGIRARELGIPFEGETGPKNSITDIDGLEVGHTTLLYEEEKREGPEAFVRTGVTAILPHGKESLDETYFCGSSVLNGNGEMTGISWIRESGTLSGPVMLTGTYSVGITRDSTLKWLDGRGYRHDALPVVGEISDEYLNDYMGHHVMEEHVFQALESARSGNSLEGNAGGGTGAICYEFKGGIGTSSRIVRQSGSQYSVGVMVQANHGLRRHLQIAGVPVGKILHEGAFKSGEEGSIVVVIATDAPLLPHQLDRLSRRASLGIARTGSVSSNGSGDFFLAFSTGNRYDTASRGKQNALWISNNDMDGLFEAAVYGTEEAIVNALVAADTLTGRDGRKVESIPKEKLAELVASRTSY